MNRTKIASQSLSLFYGQRQILYDVSIEIADKKVTALIGASGCGKSSFLSCINRMNDVVENCKISGKILIDNKNIYDKDMNVSRLRRKVGMVFQRPNPFPGSIYDNITYGVRLHKIAMKKSDMDEIVETSLRKCGLFDEVKDRLHDRASGLSGGQQQRLCIARAIAIKPQILLMDEPCSALDPIATAKIESLIDELQGEYTIVIVTHSMQQAARVSHSTAFFHKGQIVEYDETKNIFTNPKSEITGRYITGRV